MSVAERLQRRTQKQAPSKQVRLRLVYIDFWSVVKLSFLVWAVLAIVLVVATAMIWTIEAVEPILQLAPRSGPIGGGTLVAITGDGFDTGELPAVASTPPPEPSTE